MQIHGHDIGVCSWSLRAGEIAGLIERMKLLSLSHTQLALAPMLEMSDGECTEAISEIAESEIVLTAGMISFPDEDYATIATIRNTGGYIPESTWLERRELTQRAAGLAANLGIDLISTHVGFVPPSLDTHYAVAVERIGDVAEMLGKHGITLLMESGQETASELLQFLNDLRSRNVGINFDPANMILYGAGDPIDAIRVLGRHIQHVHVKDATLSDQPRMKWGSEVAFGSGQVHPRRFLDALDNVDYDGPLVIERESGAERMEDVRTAIETLMNA